MHGPIDQWPVLRDDGGVADDEVHVWRVALDRLGADAGEFFRLLSADELHRAQRFHFEQDRLRFAVCRSALRTILGRLLGEAPEKLAFDYAANGKPSVAGQVQGRTLQFNVSHSQRLALIAVAWSRKVGVDLEPLREMTEFSHIVKRYFSAHERAAFARVTEQQKCEAFFRCWVRKEAVLKVIGVGMSLPLDSFDVTLTPGEPARLLRIDSGGEPRGDTGGGLRGDTGGDTGGGLRGEGPASEAERWSLADLNPAPGFVGALAVEGSGWRLVERELARL